MKPLLALNVANDADTDELKLVIEFALELNPLASDDDIKTCDDDNDALTIATSMSVAITDNELLNDALTISTIDCEIEELKFDKFKLCVANVWATDELKSPVTLAILALLAENAVATEELNVLMLPVRLIGVLPSLPNK